MTLLIAVFAALIATITWYVSKTAEKLLVGSLALIYWGASLMWLGDAIVGFVQEGAQYFTPAPADMLNDAFLGLSVLALGLIIWMVLLVVKDPLGRVEKSLFAARES